MTIRWPAERELRRFVDRNRQDGDIGGALDDPGDFVADRHNQGANILFCDGHVEYGKQANWMNPIEAIRQRWNYDHLPHPETWH